MVDTSRQPSTHYHNWIPRLKSLETEWAMEFELILVSPGKEEGSLVGFLGEASNAAVVPWACPLRELMHL